MPATVTKIYEEEKEVNEKKAKIITIPHFKADGTPDNRWGEKPERKRQEGVVISTAMECLYNESEILAVYNVLKGKVDVARSLSKEKNARRNLCMFVAGINLGLRGGDLCKLKWANIFDTQWNYIDKPVFIPQKTKKSSTRVELTWSRDFEIEVSDYLEWLNNNIKEQELLDYIFTSQKGGYIQPKEWWKIMEAARKEAGIEQKIGTHGLRKTMAHSYIMTADDRYDAKIDMQEAFRHRDIRTTGIYACTEHDKIKNNKQRLAFIHG